MKTFKKILFIILAVLPIIPIIFNLVFVFGTAKNNAGQGAGLEAYFTDIGRELTCQPLSISEREAFGKKYYYVSHYVSYDGQTQNEITYLEQILLSPYVNVDNSGDVMLPDSNSSEATYGSLPIKTAYMLQNAGITVSAPILFVCWLLWYYFIVMVLVLVFELITFIPRKCSEIFQ